jgi:hypothetical protein
MKHFLDTLILAVFFLTGLVALAQDAPVDVVSIEPAGGGWTFSLKAEATPVISLRCILTQFKYCHER